MKNTCASIKSGEKEVTLFSRIRSVKTFLFLSMIKFREDVLWEK